MNKNLLTILTVISLLAAAGLVVKAENQRAHCVTPEPTLLRVDDLTGMGFSKGRISLWSSQNMKTGKRTYYANIKDSTGTLILFSKFGDTLIVTSTRKTVWP